MKNNLQEFMDDEIAKVNDLLENILKEQTHIPEQLKQSMLYSIEAGGKRIRPLLVLATLKDLDVKHEDAMIAAAAIELIHTYSLIHDDLPSMDDDDLRRGKPTNHIVYGEALAILAGDGMQTLAFEILSNLPHTSAEKRVALISSLAKASGAEGMVAGQVLDIEAEGKSLDLAQLQTIHTNKTGALLCCCIEFGMILSDVTDEQKSSLQEYAKHIGIAFQIQDDILDVTASTETLGKNAGSDESSDKTTYPMLLGLEQAKEQLTNHHAQAIQSLAFLDDEQSLLKEIANYIVHRNF